MKASLGYRGSASLGERGTRVGLRKRRCYLESPCGSMEAGPLPRLHGLLGSLLLLPWLPFFCHSSEQSSL